MPANKLDYYLKNIVDLKENMPPLCVQLNITGRCINTCAYCLKHTSPQTDLPFSKIEPLIDDMANMGIKNIVISGGEAFLHKELYKIVDKLKTQAFNISMITSATVLYKDDDPNSLDKILKNVDILNTSFDAFTPDIYKKTRGRGDVDTVKKFLQKVSEYRSKYTFDFNVWTVHSNVNTQQIDDIKNFVSKLNTTTHRVFNVKHAEEFMIDSPTGWNSDCWYIYINAMILHDGSVGMCCKQLKDVEDYSSIDKSTILGNINNDKFSNIWFSDSSKEIRKKLFKVRDEYCKFCDRGVEINKRIQQYSETNKVDTPIFL